MRLPSTLQVRGDDDCKHQKHWHAIKPAGSRAPAGDMEPTTRWAVPHTRYRRRDARGAANRRWATAEQTEAQREQDTPVQAGETYTTCSCGYSVPRTREQVLRNHSSSPNDHLFSPTAACTELLKSFWCKSSSGKEGCRMVGSKNAFAKSCEPKPKSVKWV